MKVRLDVDHAGGSVKFESATSRGFREALQALTLLAFARPDDVVQFPASYGMVSLRADTVDRADLTWEA